MKDQIINKNCLNGLREMQANSVDCCITSPPYFGLRDYGTDDQIGLEESPEAFVIKLTEVFEEVRRVLKPEGTLWLNLGDSYSGSGKGVWNAPAERKKAGISAYKPSERVGSARIISGIKQKDLIGIPWMVAFALRSAGWYLRRILFGINQTRYPNPIPEPVTDRCTKSHEYIFLLSKSPKYFFDSESIKTEAKNPEADYKRNNSQKEGNKYSATRQNNGIRPRKSGNIESKPGSARGCPEGSGSNVAGSVPWEGSTANKRSVWSVATKPFAEAHFATFPQELIIDMIKAGCPVGGIVLDPFMGAGTTAVVAKKLNRHYIGFELNPEYIKIAENRIHREIGLFK